MPIWMTHPEHGRTPAVGGEIEWNKQHGWTIEGEASPTTVFAEPAPSLTSDDAVGISDDPRQRYIAKFGRPPHHRMKDETIMRALED